MIPNETRGVTQIDHVIKCAAAEHHCALQLLPPHTARAAAATFCADASSSRMRSMSCERRHRYVDTVNTVTPHTSITRLAQRDRV